MSVPVLADTSVWVTLLRRGTTAAPRLAGALGEGRVATTGPVIAELLQGLPQTGRVTLEGQLSGLPFVGLGRRDWVIAGQVAGELRQRGTPASLNDVAIATAARSIDVAVLTSDRDFLEIAKVFGDLQVELVD